MPSCCRSTPERTSGSHGSELRCAGRGITLTGSGTGGQAHPPIDNPGPKWVEGSYRKTGADLQGIWRRDVFAGAQNPYLPTTRRYRSIEARYRTARVSRANSTSYWADEKVRAHADTGAQQSAAQSGTHARCELFPASTYGQCAYKAALALSAGTQTACGNCRQELTCREQAQF